MNDTSHTVTRRAALRMLAAATALAFLRPARAASGRLVAFGDSITYGLGASAPDRVYINQVAAAWGMPLRNCAVSGSHLAEIAACAAAQLLTPADTVLALVGYNDMRAGTPLATFRQQLDGMLADVCGRAGRVLIGNCLRMTPEGYAEPHGPYGSDAAVYAFNEQITAACAAAGAQLVDVCARYDPAHVTSDLVHPDDVGHAQIAAAFVRPYVAFIPVE